MSETTTIANNKDSNNWSLEKKYFILTLISIGSMLMPIACTITYSATNEIRAEFDVNDMINGLPIACFLVSFGVFVSIIWFIKASVRKLDSLFVGLLIIHVIFF